MELNDTYHGVHMSTVARIVLVILFMLAVLAWVGLVGLGIVFEYCFDRERL